ncbi:MAG TPA: RagB/SusD family nutrient uptake outer membrane protein [Pedobacter sp.]|uniref:RagB/SusD family nutrient uptake outer membrane protein n=1 Tax=Pedobacter sp. TaxID=1411316 RepID=UPI002B850CB9|nr:RagB/SusD family nutrient uptake outer membrane protein [Pedobacter sp.]HMI03568.1 RagB/SusD family nutrient uptake outer membrane protein [Pedobacter sp.]
MKLKHIIILISISIFFCGCKKFLEENPYSVLSTNNFYKTATDAELAITGLYDILNAQSIQGQTNHPLWGKGMQYLTNSGVDEVTANTNTLASDPNALALWNHTYTAENPNIWNIYFAFYAGINRANFIIERVPAISMDEERKKQIVAEAYYMRGMFYFYLGWLWGGVPLETSTVPNLTSPRATLKEVLQQAEADLKKAYQALPPRNPQAGRVNKYSAGGFLAKLYLYEASCKENNAGQNLNFPLNSFDWVDPALCYQQALTVCQDIYSNSSYTLLRPFSYLFLSATEATARNENMMVVQTGTGGTLESFLYPSYAGPVGNYLTMGGTLNMVRPVKEGYLRYNANDGRKNGYSGYLSSTTNFTTLNGHKYYTPDPINAQLTNLCINKWREDDAAARQSRGISPFGGETDFALLRFGDILLMFAEAKFKTGDEPGARALFHELRLRACSDDATKVNAITTVYLKSDFMAELLDERSRELMAEGWRRFDLIRFGKIKSVIAALDASFFFNGGDIQSVKTNFQDYKIWFPIPSRDIATNPNLIQNPGY